jgi:hypothetical protein
MLFCCFVAVPSAALSAPFHAPQKNTLLTQGAPCGSVMDSEQLLPGSP